MIHTIKTELADKYCMDIIDNNNNMLVPWYLMAAYAYYVEDDPIISDNLYDRMAKKLADNWETIEHQHKQLLSLDQVQAGTYLGEYPSRVKGAVEEIRHVISSENKPKRKRK